MKPHIHSRFLSLITPLVFVAALFLSGCTSAGSAITTGNASTAATTSTSTSTSASATASSGSAASVGAVTDSDSGKTYDTKTTYNGNATSYTGRKDNYSVGYYVSDGKLVSANSLLASSETSLSSLKLSLASNGTGFTPVIATGKSTVLDLTGTVTCTDTSDGSNASDYTGLGTQIIASNYAKVNVSNLTMNTSGFARDAFIADSHAQITVSGSAITTSGADPLTQAYSGYQNTANQNIMISPPWVLGIQGGVRLANLLGENSTLSVVNSTLTSGSWAVLSTDAGSNPVINVLDSTLSLLPESKGGMSSGKFSYSASYGSGYGSYLIGNAAENFYGTSISGTTYGAILCGGTATYQSSNGSIVLKNADGDTVGTYTGKNQVSAIDSVFGFMSHNNGTISVIDGTKVTSQDAVFLYKAGDVTFNADKAILDSKSGVILQMMDNDDSTVGATNGNGGPVFNTTFSEKAGWPSENGSVTASGGQSNTVNLNLTNGTYTGSIYNGTGYYSQSGDALNVTLGKGAALSGAISLTETRHVDENGDQKTSFTINEYYYLGHVANKEYNNSTSKLAVTLSDGAVWTVTGTSYLTSLTVSNGTVQAADGKTVTMTVDGVQTQIVSGQTYTGNIVINVK